MQITRQAEYAIRIMLELAKLSPGEIIQSRFIAENQNLPDKFVQKIIQILVRSGFVESRRGTMGGVRLSVPADSITIADIIASVEGKIAINPCLKESHHCSNQPHCRVRKVIQRGQEALLKELSRDTLADLIGVGEEKPGAAPGSAEP